MAKKYYQNPDKWYVRVEDDDDIVITVPRSMQTDLAYVLRSSEYDSYRMQQLTYAILDAVATAAEGEINEA